MRGFTRLSGSISSHLIYPPSRPPHSSQLSRYSGPHHLRKAPHSANPLVPLRRFTNKAEYVDSSEFSGAWFVDEPDNGPRYTQSYIITPGMGPPDLVDESSTMEMDDVEPVRSHEPECTEHEAHELAALRSEFYSIIQECQPEQVMAALLEPRFVDLVKSMPQSTFVEAFHLLSPAYFVDPYREIHRPLHPSAVKIKQYRSLESIFDEFANNLALITRIRRLGGQALGLAEYTHLLDCARSIGDAVMADHAWDIMQEDEVVPDIRCYNYYMEAKVWDLAYTGREKYRMRMTPFLYRKRRFYAPNPGWQGYGTAGRSVRKEVLEIFNQMTEEGNYGDEASFVNVILASSRVGHFKGVKNVLKTVWNVDVDALQEQADESELPPVIEYERSSPLYPTSRLLFAIAHAFGTNNDIPAALRTIDFISNSYDIFVPETVWLELFERSFVLSRPRFGPDARRNAKGKVSYEFLNNMFQTMTSEPFNVRPTVEMHHILAKCAWDRARLSEFQYHMGAAYDLMKETRRKRRAARSIVESYLAEFRVNDSQIDPSLLRSRAFSEAVHTYDILRLRVSQQINTLERLARLLLIHHRWTGRNNPAWECQLLPRALEEWQDFLPESFVYYTRAGLVQFHGATTWGQRRLTTHQRIPVRRPTVDNKVEFDEEYIEMDDDVFWRKYRKAFPQLDLSSPSLKRLFGDSYESTKSPAYENNTPPAESLDYESYDPESESPYSHTNTQRRKPSSTRQTQRVDEYDHSYSTLTSDFTMA